MKKGENYNRPVKGSSIVVEPIRDQKDIQNIKRLIRDNPRDFCLFTLGINTNLRASDLLRIRVDQVKDLREGDELVLKEKKTGKSRRITINKAAIEATRGLLREGDHNDSDLLFQGQRGPLTVPSVNRMVKQWCATVNLKGNYGSHTLRKTWGYHQRVTFGRGLPELMLCFNHSSQRQTLDYLGIQPEEIKSIYLNEL
jgi:integrase